jgi:NADPH:quinone reductase-like Zn-dependent oxidoreductase
MIHWYDLKGATGTYAEAVAVDAGVLARLPAGLDYATAATIPLNALSAAQGIDLLGLAEPTVVLVTGASGAVGSFAVQLAVNAGHRVTAVANAGDRPWVQSLGAAEVLDRDADLAAYGLLTAVFDAVPLGEPALSAIADNGTLVTTRPLPDAQSVLASGRKVDARTSWCAMTEPGPPGWFTFPPETAAAGSLFIHDPAAVNRMLSAPPTAGERGQIVGL